MQSLALSPGRQGSDARLVRVQANAAATVALQPNLLRRLFVFFVEQMLQGIKNHRRSISGLVVEYIVAIDVTRVRFPADAFFHMWSSNLPPLIAANLPH